MVDNFGSFDGDNPGIAIVALYLYGHRHLSGAGLSL